jgi:hypothetical protein
MRAVSSARGSEEMRMTGTMTVWYANRTNGKFQAGRFYTKDQLGVTGRMAVKAGFLTPMEQSVPKKKPAKAPQGVARPRRGQRAQVTQGVSGGEADVQTGGGPEIRDDSGPQGS